MMSPLEPPSRALPARQPPPTGSSTMSGVAAAVTSTAGDLSAPDARRAPALDADDVPLEDEPLPASATASCRYGDAEDAWRCGDHDGGARDGGARTVGGFVARRGARTTAGDVRFAPAAVDGCFRAIDVEVATDDEPVRIDFGRVTATAAGIVVGIRGPPGGVVFVPRAARARSSSVMHGLPNATVQVPWQRWLG